MLKQNVIAFLFVLIFHLGHSQDIILSGTVLNSCDKTPIIYATVRLNQLPIGTVTNAEGKFVLVVPGDLKDSLVLISSIGFRNCSIVQKRLVEQELIFLEPYVGEISEISVSAQKTNPKEILQKTAKCIEQNVQKEYQSSNVYCRNFISLNGRFYLYKNALFEANHDSDDIWSARGSNDCFSKMANKIGEKYAEHLETETFVHNSPPYVLGRQIISDYFKDNSKFNVSIDTVAFNENGKVYVIDVFHSKVNPDIKKDILSVMSRCSSPYLMIFDTSLQAVAESITQMGFRNAIRNGFTRYYIDANQNFNIIKEVSVGLLKIDNCKTFQYTVRTFSNTPGKSVPSRILQYRQSVSEDKSKRYSFKSIFETFVFESPKSSVRNNNGEILSFIYSRLNGNSEGNTGRLKAFVKDDELLINALEEIADEGDFFE